MYTMHGKWSLGQHQLEKTDTIDTPLQWVWCECISLAVKGGPFKVRSRRMLYSLISHLLSSNMQQVALLLWVQKPPCHLEWVPLQTEMYSDMSLKIQRFKSSKPNIKEVMKKMAKTVFQKLKPKTYSPLYIPKYECLTCEEGSIVHLPETSVLGRLWEGPGPRQVWLGMKSWKKMSVPCTEHLLSKAGKKPNPGH